MKFRNLISLVLLCVLLGMGLRAWADWAPPAEIYNIVQDGSKVRIRIGSDSPNDTISVVREIDGEEAVIVDRKQTTELLQDSGADDDQDHGKYWVVDECVPPGFVTYELLGHVGSSNCELWNRGELTVIDQDQTCPVIGTKLQCESIDYGDSEGDCGCTVWKSRKSTVWRLVLGLIIALD